jgi:hypothetical protein
MWSSELVVFNSLVQGKKGVEKKKFGIIAESHPAQLKGQASRSFFLDHQEKGPSDGRPSTYHRPIIGLMVGLENPGLTYVCMIVFSLMCRF